VFASLFSSKPRTVSLPREDFAVVGRALAYRGDLDADDTVYEFFIPNLFDEPMSDLRSYTTYRGSDLARVAEDIIKLKQEQKLPTRKQEYIDVSTMPSLKDIGFDKAFKYEVYETVKDGLPNEDFKNWSDITEFQKRSYERSQDLAPRTIEKSEIIIKDEPLADEPEYDYVGSDVTVSKYEYDVPFKEDSVIRVTSDVPKSSVDDMYITATEKRGIREAEEAGIDREEFLERVAQLRRQK